MQILSLNWEQYHNLIHMIEVLSDIHFKQNDAYEILNKVPVKTCLTVDSSLLYGSLHVTHASFRFTKLCLYNLSNLFDEPLYTFHRPSGAG